MFILGFLVALIAALSRSVAADSSVDCVNQLINWCNGQDFRGVGNNIISTSDTDDNGNHRYVYCITNAYGSNCYSNNQEWYKCSSDHKVTYKNNPLTQDSADGTDSEICSTARKASSNQFSYNSEETRRQVEETMTNVRQNLDNIFQPCFPFCNHNPFGPGFPFN